MSPESLFLFCLLSHPLPWRPFNVQGPKCQCNDGWRQYRGSTQSMDFLTHLCPHSHPGKHTGHSSSPLRPGGQNTCVPVEWCKCLPSTCPDSQPALRGPEPGLAISSGPCILCSPTAPTGRSLIDGSPLPPGSNSPSGHRRDCIPLRWQRAPSPSTQGALRVFAGLTLHHPGAKRVRLRVSHCAPSSSPSSPLWGGTEGVTWVHAPYAALLPRPRGSLSLHLWALYFSFWLSWVLRAGRIRWAQVGPSRSACGRSTWA